MSNIIYTAAPQLRDLNSRKEVAEYTGIAVQTLARFAVEGKGPKFIKLGGAVRYTRDAVLEWIAQAAA